MDSDAFASFGEELDKYSLGADKGWAAYHLHSLAEDIFGYESRPTLFSNWAPREVAAKTGPAAIVPIRDASDVAFVTTVLEQTSLYAGFTALLMPNELSTGYVSYSANEFCRVDDQSAADALLMANLMHSDLVVAGRCAFLPTSSRHWWGSGSDDGERVVNAPLFQEPAAARFRPFNPATYRPHLALHDALVVYKQVLLPFFPGADLDLVTKIAETETESFRRFNEWLGRALARVATMDSTDALENLHGELDEKIDSLAQEARRIAMMKSLRDIDVGFFALSFAVASQAPGTVGSGWAALVGSASLLDLLHRVTEQRHAEHELKRNTFYLPWVLANAAH